MLDKIKKLAKFSISPVSQYIKNRGFRQRTQYAHFLTGKLREQTVLYESYHGKNATGNVYALFLGLLKDPEYSNFTHVWALNNPNDESAEMLRKYKNVRVIERNSTAYLKYVAQAKYLINDTSFPAYFNKRKEQVYINTWHGTPFKTIGSEVKGAAINAHGNIQHNFLHTDYLVSPNRYTAKKLLDSNHVTGIFEGQVLDAGYPRVDLTFQTDVLKMKEQLGVATDKKIILFAPTWRDLSTNRKEDDAKKVYETFLQLKDKFDDDYTILLKVHYFVFEVFRQKGLSQYCVPEWIDTNALLSCVDILITDYSSIFFDFLPTKRPVLFYTYDQAQYEEERGVYFPFEDLPGPLCSTLEDLMFAIANIEDMHEKYNPQYQKMLQDFCYNDDGGATKRVIDTIFKGNPSPHLYQTKEQNKKKILIWGGGFLMNGITMSLISLLQHIDYNKFDVTLVFASKLNDATRHNLMQINPNTRIIYRPGTLNYLFHEVYLHTLVRYFGLGNKYMQKLMPKKLYQQEYKRVFGNATFDIAIDYCGYTPFWSLIFSSSPIPRKSIYLHSDMASDAKRSVLGTMKHKKNFNIIFHLYRYYDQLIGVSKDATVTNKVHLASFGVADKIVNVDNALDTSRILDHLDDVNVQTIDGKDYLITQQNVGISSIRLSGLSIPNKEHINFVTVARLSPEKDHAKLIEAFADVHRMNPQARLYILGDGALKNTLQRLINSLGLENKAFLMGALNQPFPFVNMCDCFVLSSNYEGQGLAVLEALTLQKPVISTDIPGPRGILQNNLGMLVENSKEGLAEGMNRFINEKPTYDTFDYVAYNEQALKAFNEKVCGISS